MNNIRCGGIFINNLYFVPELLWKARVMTKNYNDLGVEFKYLIVNDMDQKYGLWVNTVGFQSIQPNSPYPLKDHPTGYFSMRRKDGFCASTSWSILLKGGGVLLGDHAREASVQRTTDGAVSWSVAYILSLCADGLE